VYPFLCHTEPAQQARIPPRQMDLGRDASPRVDLREAKFNLRSA
jgi:hypothetical protein